MSDSILVAYATRYGSTQEVAEAIAERLRQHGLDAEARRARDVRSLDGYDAVVLGTPIYIGSMLKDAREFLERNRPALDGMPVAIFALGPARPEDDIDEARGQLDDALGKLEWLRPAKVEMFVGRYDPSRLRLADRLLAALPASPLHGMEEYDGRNWTVIGEWADRLPAALHASVPSA